MIHISTEPFKLESSSDEVFKYLSDISNLAKIIAFKKTKHLEVKGDKITLILKWAARFNFTISSVTNKYILIESTENVQFSTAFRFDIEEEKFGSSMILHAETDTSPVIDFTLEAKLKTWINAMIINLKTKFN
tara:strand:+ start:831 stop:1229 length:399 start_codon:yes stop_codon:yes gene_type:complete